VLLLPPPPPPPPPPQHCRRVPPGVPPTLINVGRGDVASEATLLAAVTGPEPLLSRCVLDVFPTEPLPESSALWAHPAVLLTPHVAAVSYAGDVAGLFAENLARFVHREDLQHVVDWEKGY
jgi:glyoxylate/hydroxypyruvate reductase A